MDTDITPQNQYAQYVENVQILHRYQKITGILCVAYWFDIENVNISENIEISTNFHINVSHMAIPVNGCTNNR